MKKYTLALTAGLVLATGCIDKTIVSPENAATVDALEGDLTRAGVQTLALGVIAADRAFVRGDATYYQLSAIYARDAYRIEATEPRYVTETITGAPDPGSFAGSGGWTNGYVATRAAISLLTALPGVGGDPGDRRRERCDDWTRTDDEGPRLLSIARASRFARCRDPRRKTTTRFLPSVARRRYSRRSSPFSTARTLPSPQRAGPRRCPSRCPRASPPTAAATRRWPISSSSIGDCVER